MISDLRSAIRALLSAPALTAIALVTLSVGLALCITVLTVVNAYVIRAGLPNFVVRDVVAVLAGRIDRPRFGFERRVGRLGPTLPRQAPSNLAP